MNKKKLAYLIAAPLCAGLGFYLSFRLFTPQMSFIETCLVAGLQEILMFGLPAVFLLLGLSKRHDFSDINIEKSDPMDAGMSMLAAVSYVLAGTLLGAVVYTLLTSFGINIQLPPTLEPKTIPDLLAATLTIALVTAICEELLFRGALMVLLRRKLNENWSMAISAIVFAALHFSIVGFPTMMVFALFLHRLYINKRNLLLPIIFHAMYNFSILVMNYAQASPGIAMILLSTSVFVLSARFLLRGEGDDTRGARA